MFLSRFVLSIAQMIFTKEIKGLLKTPLPGVDSGLYGCFVILQTGV